MQIVDLPSSAPQLDWRAIDLTTQASVHDQQLRITELQQQDRQESDSLQRSGLIRVYLIRLSAACSVCMLSSHLGILDGWSMPLLLAYVHRTYLRLIDGLQLVSGSEASSASVDTELNYGDAQRYLQEHCEEHRAFWIAYVSQLDSVMDLSEWLLPQRAAVRLSDYKRIAEPAEQRMIIRDALYIARKSGVLSNTA